MTAPIPTSTAKIWRCISPSKYFYQTLATINSDRNSSSFPLFNSNNKNLNVAAAATVAAFVASFVTMSEPEMEPVLYSQVAVNHSINQECNEMYYQLGTSSKIEYEQCINKIGCLNRDKNTTRCEEWTLPTPASGNYRKNSEKMNKNNDLAYKDIYLGQLKLESVSCESQKLSSKKIRRDTNEKSSNALPTKDMRIMRAMDLGNPSSFLIDQKRRNKEIYPFPLDQVGACSCHGLEPHIYFGNKSQTRFSTTAMKKKNQDRGHVIRPFGGINKTALFGIYDGHGDHGEVVAEYIMACVEEGFRIDKFQNTDEQWRDSKKATLYQYLRLMESDSNDKSSEAKELSDDLTRQRELFKHTFLDIDKQIKGQPHMDPFGSGSTACVVLVQGGKLTVANIGDSRAVIARSKIVVTENGEVGNGITPLLQNKFKLVPINLSKDQNAKDPQEKKRVLDAGGFVTMPPKEAEDLPARVWLDKDCSHNGLAMTRSIGDHSLKKSGVIANPVVTQYRLDNEDKFIIVASDGIWEFMSSSEAIHIVQQCFEKGKGASDACNELISVAMKKWKEEEDDYRDDITAIVVKLDGLWENEY